MIKEISHNKTEHFSDKNIIKLSNFIEINDYREIELIKYFIDKILELNFDKNDLEVEQINDNENLLSMLIKNLLSDNIYLRHESYEVIESIFNNFNLKYEDIKSLIS